MKKIPAIICILILQVYLVTKGITLFDKLLLPFLIFGVSIAILSWYFVALLSAPLNDNNISHPGLGKYKIAGFALGALSVLALCTPLLSLFTEHPDPGTGSDIIPQLTTLYERFSKGLQPYYPLEQYPWHPFPVYMPLHWLPIGLADALHMDARWVQVLFLAFSCGIWGFSIFSPGSILKKCLATLLPAAALYAFILWAPLDTAFSYELIIAAYYVLLCAGLASGNLVTVTSGIIVCMLSRYTMIFWLPLFFVLLWSNASKKKNLWVWASIIAAVLVFYLLPFYLKDTSILSHGIKYHNDCYVNDWNGLGHPEQSTAFDQGMNFSYFVCHSLSGDMQYRVYMARIVQATLMLVLLLTGLLTHRRWKHEIRYTDFSLGMLYCFILVFFMFSPITYRYYYISLLAMSAILCGKIILSEKHKRQLPENEE